MANTAEEALRALEALEAEHALSIIKLSDSIAFPDGVDDSGTTRSSDVSADNNTDGDTNPATLRADLAHYKELFSKLRFSYIEQVTKEKFLHAITAPSPTLIEPSDNAALELKLADEKTALKRQKDDVAAMIANLEARGRALAQRHERIQAQKATLGDLPGIIAGLESDVAALSAAHPSPRKAVDPSLNLPLPETQALLAEREARLQAVQAQVRALQAAVPRREAEVLRLERELAPLVRQKGIAVEAARAARRSREEGGVDEVEERGRWYKASEAVLRRVLEVEA